MVWRGAVIVAAFLAAAIASAQLPQWQFDWASSTNASSSGAPLYYGRVHTAPDGGAVALAGNTVTRYDSAGSFLWRRTFGAPFLGSSQYRPKPEPYNAAAGLTGVYFSGLANREYPKGDDPFVAKYDNSGKLLWVRYFTMPAGLGGTFTFVKVDSSDDVILAADDGTQTVLAKFDPNGKFLWGYRPYVTFFSSNVIQDLQLDSQGNIFLLGTGVNVGNTEPYVAKVSPGGQILWTKAQYQTGVNYSVSTFQVLADGSVEVPFIFKVGTQPPGTMVKHFSSAGSVQSYFQINGASESIIAVGGSGETYCLASSDDGVQSNGYPMLKITPQNTVGYSKILTVPAINASVNLDSSLTICSAWGEINRTYFPAQLMRLDATGNVVWSKTFGTLFNAGTYAGALADLESGTAICSFSSGYVSPPWGIAKIDGSGNIVWQDLNPTSSVVQMTNMTGYLTASGSLLFTGNYPVFDGNLNQTQFEGWFGQIDSTGSVVRSQSDQGPANNYQLSAPTTIVPTKDGGYLIDNPIRRYDASSNLVWQGSFNLSPTITDASGDVYCLGTTTATKLNPDGSIAWQVPLPLPAGAHLAAFDPSGNIVCALDNGASMGAFELSPSGTLLWKNLQLKAYPTDVYTDIDVDANGNAYLSSNRYVGGTIFGFITKYSPLGVKDWETKCAIGINCPITHTVLNGLGDLYTVGQTGLNGVQQMIVIKMGANDGQIEWTCLPFPKTVSGAVDISLDAQHFLVVCGYSFAEPKSYDYTLMSITPDGALERLSYYDTGVCLPEQPSFSGLDTAGNVYIVGSDFGNVGEFQPHVVRYKATPLDDAWVSGQAIPTAMTAGESTLVSVKVTNAGRNTWTAAAGYRLDCLESTTWSPPSIALSPTDSIARGGAKTFYTNLFAPVTPGVYALQFRMEHSGALFGNPSTLVNVSVSTAADAAAFQGQVVPTSVKAGATFTVAESFKNVGTNTWTAAGGYMLASIDPELNNIWGLTSVSLSTSDAIAPGAGKSFSFTCTAPKTPGTYELRWQMYKTGTGFFGDMSNARMITVTP